MGGGPGGTLQGDGGEGPCLCVTRGPGCRALKLSGLLAADWLAPPSEEGWLLVSFPASPHSCGQRDTVAFVFSSASLLASAGVAVMEAGACCAWMLGRGLIRVPLLLVRVGSTSLPLARPSGPWVCPLGAGATAQLAGVRCGHPGCGRRERQEAAPRHRRPDGCPRLLPWEEMPPSTWAAPSNPSEPGVRGPGAWAQGRCP